ncbi:MAG: hypothetical protein DRP79_00225 [Planctomycetota bacterium]|nr:MAG: hypothetical protein DRP79_00225 [Planctomycetota bacterium]
MFRRALGSAGVVFLRGLRRGIGIHKVRVGVADAPLRDEITHEMPDSIRVAVVCKTGGEAG